MSIGNPTAPSVSDFPPDIVKRMELTLSCRDTDDIPKVEAAGQVRIVNGAEVQVMHNGVVVLKDCYQGPWMTELIRRLRGHHEPQEELVFQRVLERIAATEAAPSMIELGSWWAYYSLWFQHSLTGARVVALEPDPAFLEVGRRNFELNQATATFVWGAIGPRPGQTLSFTAESDGKTYDVPQYSLDSLIRLGDLNRVSLVLADIQGAETALIAQSRALLTEGRIRFMIVSTHHNLISGDALTHQRVLTGLKDIGAHVVADHSVGESYSGDGLVAVSFAEQDRDLTVEVGRARHSESVFGELEPQLDAAWRALNHAERHIARLERESQLVGRELERAHAELEAMKRTRLWRWTAHPRALVDRVRRRQGGRPRS